MRSGSAVLAALATATSVGAQAITPDSSARLRYLLSTGETGVYVRPLRTGKPFKIAYAQGAGAPVFTVEFLDVTNGTGVGFDDPVTGATRRATVGAVFAYLQALLANTGSCEIEFNESQLDGTGFLATAGPLFPDPGDACVDPLTVTNITTGVDAFPADPDGRCTVDFGYTWNDDLGAPTGAETDLFSVILHELTHALGFSASIGCTSPTGIDTRFKNWDPFMEESGTAFITCPDANYAGADLTGDLRLNAGPVNAAWQALGNPGSPPLFSPSPCVPGSSISHWNTTDPDVPANAVMRHSIGTGDVRRIYQPLDRAALDMLKYSTVGDFGACCLCDGTCVELLEADCTGMGGVQFFDLATSCISVTCVPAASPSIAGPTLVCPGMSGNLYSITSPNPSATYVWSIAGSGAIIGSTSGTSVTVDAFDQCNASFTLTATCTSGDCVTASDLAVSVDDDVPPVFTILPVSITVECDGAGNVAALTVFLNQPVAATDDCPLNLVVTRTDCALSDGCGATGSCMVTWTASDGCNDVEVTRTFTIQDTTPPVIVCPGKLIVSCAAGPPPPDPASVFAADICGAAVVSHVGDVESNPGCPREITRTYRATDACGLTTDCTQTIYVDRLHPGWNSLDNEITLTANEPAYWSALTGQPKGLSSFEVLDPGFPPGRPAMDGTNDRVLRGYIVAFAVGADGNEIRWNHLAGGATIVNYRDALAWEHSTWAHQVVAPVADGAQTGDPGTLSLDGVEYSSSCAELLLNFQAVSANAFSSPAAGVQIVSDTDLILFPPAVDLRQSTGGPVATKADFTVWNQNEVKFSGAHRCVTCWDQTLLSRNGIPNHFLVAFLQTQHGKARIDGRAAAACDVLDDPATPQDESLTSVDSPLLGTQVRLLDFDGARTAAAGWNLFGSGFDDTAAVLYDAGSGSQEATWPDDPVRLVDELIALASGATTSGRPPIRAPRRMERQDPIEPMTLGGPGQDRVTASEKGSLLFLSQVELRWDENCELYQDTFLSITNDGTSAVRVRLYFINGDPPITDTP
jgi:hypothetical protein